MTSQSRVQWGANTSKSSTNWGDVEDNDDAPLPLATSSSSSSSSSGPVVPVVSSTKVDAKGIKTVVEYGTDAGTGEKIKITRKIKVSTKPVRVNRHVLERQEWAKFGDCTGLPRGPEQNVTYQSFEIIHLDLRPKKREEEKEESSLDKLSGTSSIVVCRNCGETGHWTLKCPKRQSINAFSKPGDNGSGPDSSSSSSSAQPVAGTGSKYTPMHLRLGAGERPGASSGHVRPEDAWSLRVANLSDDVNETDLQDLFRRFGHTTRITLVRDHQTHESRGFAYINYSSKHEAELAISKLNGHGYANLILTVEFSKPREARKPADK